jgi:hypothetical protein
MMAPMHTALTINKINPRDDIQNEFSEFKKEKPRAWAPVYETACLRGLLLSVLNSVLYIRSSDHS